MVARPFATAALWVRIQTSLKNHKIGDISKGVVNTLKPAKKNNKKINKLCSVLHTAFLNGSWGEPDLLSREDEVDLRTASLCSAETGHIYIIAHPLITNTAVQDQVSSALLSPATPPYPPPPQLSRGWPAYSQPLLSRDRAHLHHSPSTHHQYSPPGPGELRPPLFSHAILTPSPFTRLPSHDQPLLCLTDCTLRRWRYDMANSIPYLVPTQFQESIFPPRHKKVSGSSPAGMSLTKLSLTGI